MKLKITSGSFFNKRVLKVDAQNFTFYEWGNWGGGKKFAFSDVRYILMSNDNTLSFQAKSECFSIPNKPDDLKHHEVIDTFVREVGRTDRSGMSSFAGPVIR